jgi:hypothetical protein
MLRHDLVFHAFLEEPDCVFCCFTLLLKNVFDSHFFSYHIPFELQTRTNTFAFPVSCLVQQVVDLLVVQLDVLNADCELDVGSLFLPLTDILKQRLYAPGDETIISPLGLLISLIDLVLVAVHGERLPRAGLAVDKHRGMEATHHLLDKVVHPCSLKDSSLVTI